MKSSGMDDLGMHPEESYCAGAGLTSSGLADEGRGVVSGSEGFTVNELLILEKSRIGEEKSDEGCWQKAYEKPKEHYASSFFLDKRGSDVIIIEDVMGG